MSEAWEKVVTVTNWYDGPLEGVAYCKGELCAFTRNFDFEADEYFTFFNLTLVDERWLSLIEESWAIWLRWESAFQSGQTTIESHPALPEEAERSEELEALLKPVLQVPDNATAAFGTFRKVDSNSTAARQERFEVSWTPLKS